jgi:CRP/FNR family transcriptional regulator, anaerobic regulatory protein
MDAVNKLFAGGTLGIDGAAGAVIDLVVRAPNRECRRVRRAESLYAAGDPFMALSVVRSGVLKSLTRSEGGKVQVTGFHLVGDVVGLDGIDAGLHQVGVVALEDAEVYVLPFAECVQRSRESAHCQRLLARLMACEIERCHELMFLLGTMRAPQRLAAFLLDLSERYGRLGYSRSRLVLRMTRKDIGNYLGLKVETICRLLARLQREELLHVKGKTIALLDLPALRRIGGLAAREGPCAPARILDREGNFLAG